jgi:tetratricopeptide (TPR) repeat protein
LSGREEQWNIVTQHRVLLAQESRNWAETERLQGVRVDWNRRRATSLLARPAESLSAGEKNAIRSLAVALLTLGQVQEEASKSDCIESYEESARYLHLLNDNTAEASAIVNLGNSYLTISSLRNLDLAEQNFRLSLELYSQDDRHYRAFAFGQLGRVARERFKDAKTEEKTKEELLKHLSAAMDYYQQTLALLPPDAVSDLAIAHNQLGLTYDDAGDLERALENYNHAVHFYENAGNIYSAGTTRRNMAIALANNGRLSDALLYARAALRNFESYGGRAKDQEDRTKGVIGEIEKAIHE